MAWGGKFQRDVTTDQLDIMSAEFSKIPWPFPWNNQSRPETEPDLECLIPIPEKSTHNSTSVQFSATGGGGGLF